MLAENYSIVVYRRRSYASGRLCDIRNCYAYDKTIIVTVWKLPYIIKNGI